MSGWGGGREPHGERLNHVLILVIMASGPNKKLTATDSNKPWVKYKVYLKISYVSIPLNSLVADCLKRPIANVAHSNV